MTSNFNSEILKIFTSLSQLEKLNFLANKKLIIGCSAGSLLEIGSDNFETPVKHLSQAMTTMVSPLEDQSPDYELLNKLISELNKDGLVKSLNHVGFCYHVDSQGEEKSILLSEVKGSPFKLYEEPSYDLAKWYFVGDTTQWEDPLIEMLPVESQNETFKDYWLPHIHLDIDTGLTEVQIENLIYKLYEGEPQPIRSTVIDDVVYTVRLRLGIIDGINIFLDLSTNHRMVEFYRKNLLKQIS